MAEYQTYTHTQNRKEMGRELSLSESFKTTECSEEGMPFSDGRERKRVELNGSILTRKRSTFIQAALLANNVKHLKRVDLSASVSISQATRHQSNRC